MYFVLQFYLGKALNILVNPALVVLLHELEKHYFISILETCLKFNKYSIASDNVRQYPLGISCHYKVITITMY